jgi:hypothetical protein
VREWLEGLGRRFGDVTTARTTRVSGSVIDDPDIDVARFRILDPEPPDVRHALGERLGRTRRHVLASSQRPQVDDTWERLRHDVHHHGRDGHGIDR